MAGAPIQPGKPYQNYPTHSVNPPSMDSTTTAALSCQALTQAWLGRATVVVGSIPGGLTLRARYALEELLVGLTRLDDCPCHLWLPFSMSHAMGMSK